MASLLPFLFVSFFRLFVCLFVVRSCVRSFVRVFVPLFVCSFVRVCSCVRVFVCSFDRSFVHLRARPLARWPKANARNVSFRNFLQWPTYVVNSVDEPNFVFKVTIASGPNDRLTIDDCSFGIKGNEKKSVRTCTRKSSIFPSTLILDDWFFPKKVVKSTAVKDAKKKNARLHSSCTSLWGKGCLHVL